jgi:hypothetical protein
MPHQKAEAQAKRDQFSIGSFSDHLTTLRAFQLWEALPYEKQAGFCVANFMSHNTMVMIKDIKQQLLNTLEELGFVSTSELASKQKRIAKTQLEAGSIEEEKQLCVVRAIVGAVMSPSIAFIEYGATRSNKRTPQKQKPQTHPSFVVMSGQSNILVHPGSVNAR